ncbi:autotransporter outer membrane beta-barrel domain-containing protein [Buttiauxella sp. WJP83]|uniref:autotransporter outer membrane beta-barrel domain-containing protein n=1 Tax=Buttiauxella sp. WJP83 TaxID=2986951 RepID=UPI0022DD97B8|nr:autotransporter outer membrane beta-barrel domain-containing protein [Buttiauxella sp. WJP83]WBM69307.1 autotransporter outer membrane beta-barrel domain-containing protein [Buttiauxella sp. WJP83]
MNRIYRLVWNESQQALVVASETTKSRKKGRGKVRHAVALSVSLLMAAPVYADEVNWSTAYPSYLFPPLVNYDQVRDTGIAFTIDNNTATANHYAAGTTLDILGPIPQIAPGVNGSATSVLVRDALTDSGGPEAGRITSIVATDSQGNTTPITSANIDTFSYSTNPSTPLQNQELNVEVPGLEGSFSVIKVYDSGTFAAPGTSLVGDLSLNVYDPNSFRIYNNFGIAAVTDVGGIANINIGDDTNGTSPIAAPTNTIELLAKNSILAQASATGTPTSSTNWISDNYIHFAPAAVISSDISGLQAVSSEYSDSITLPNYIQVGPQVILDPLQPSITFTINSAQDIATVNDFLLGQGAYAGRQSQLQLWLTGGVQLPPAYGSVVIDSSTIAQNTYNGIIAELLGDEQQNRVNLTYHVWNDQLAHTNNATLSTGELNVIYATGANASGTVTTQGSLGVDGASAVMRGDNNAVLTNNGAINAWSSSGSSPTAIAMKVTDATALNTGTINAGLFIEKDETNQNVHNQGSIGIQGLGASTVNNQGFINIALTDGSSASAVGLQARGTTTATNSGTITLTGNSFNADGRASGHAVDIGDDATFTNAASGNIFIGSTPITATKIYTPVLMVGGQEQSAGIVTSSTGDVTNDGTITLGAQTRNAVGMLVNGATGQVTNNGIINVLGQLAGGAAAPNYGLSVIDTQNVTNNGFINVFGDNNAAISILASTQAATAVSTNTGVITVGAAGDAGGSDNNPLTYRNYAVYAEGLKGIQATANIDSTMNLLAAGAIGAHARGSATINVGPDAALNFNNNDQIGYYAYGQAAQINLANAVIDDNDQTHAFLFLIDHGATFDGDSGTSAGAYQLTLTGDRSIGVFAHGLDDGPDGQVGTGDDVLSTLNTGAATINVNGENAVGVKVAGGAQGTINDGGIILSHDNTTGVVVDGRIYTIDGNVSNANDARSTLVSSDVAITTSAAQSGITGYDVSYKGQVTLGGAGINLNGDNSTGLRLHDGGIGINNAPISVSGANNIGVHIQNQGTLTNTGAIAVSGAPGSGNVGVKVQGVGAQVTQLGIVTANGGLAAVQLIDNGATLTINGTGNHITASGGADGIRMDAGAASLTASNTVIDISGSGAGINNNASTSNINLNTVTINASDGPAIRTAVTFNAEGTGNILNVSGSGAGFAFEQADGSNTTGNLSIGTGYTINVPGTTGANGNGILAKTNGSVTSSANITMGASSGSAISAIDASAVTNGGNIQTTSDVNSSVRADNAASFTNTGTINSTSTANTQALVRVNGTASARTILNSGTITDSSQNSVAIDASGAANNTITNQGTLSAASNTATAILSGSGNDLITLNGGSTLGLITAGSGTDTFTWNSGTFNGAVDFTEADGNDKALIGNVDLGNTRHILSEGGTNNQLTLTDTHLWNGGAGPALIGTLAADDVATATNIGTGWSTLSVNGTQGHVRVVNDLVLSGTPSISITGGSRLRTGDNAVTANNATINNYNVNIDGLESRIVFDGTSAAQLYSGIISGTGQLNRATGGTTILTGENSYTGNTIIDTGGTLQLGVGGVEGALSPATDIIDNGILIINQSDVVNLGGVIIGTGAFHQVGTGVTRLTGANTYAGVTLVNAGTLLVNGNQSAATGDTTVAGTLGGTGIIGGNVLFTGSTLAPGDGGAGTLTINGNLTLAPTTNNQFELGERFVPGGTLNDLVNVGGNLTLDGDLNVTTSAGGIFAPGVYRLFNYNGSLVNNGLSIVSLPPNNSAIYNVQTTLPNQVNLILGFAPDTTNLQFWDGDDVANHGPTGIEGNSVVNGGNGIWSSSAGVNDNKWTLSDGVGNAPWQQQAFAIFQGDAGTVVVSNANGPVVTSGMQFDTDGYLLTGGTLDIARSISQVPTTLYASQGETPADAFFAIRVGAGGAGADVTTTINTTLHQTSLLDTLKLIKLDPGRLILTGSNDYRGGTVVYDGTLNVSSDANLGLAGTSILINNNSTLQIGADYATARPIFLSATGGGQFDLFGHTFTPTLIGGDGGLTVRDSSAGTDASNLELNNANTYQGATTITGKNGTADVNVNANITGALGPAASVLTVNNQATLNFNNSASAQTHTVNLDNSTLNFNDSANAEGSVINAANGADVNFASSANGGNSAITLAAGTSLNLNDTANAGSATVANSGLVTFAGNAQAQNAKIANNTGGVVNIASSTSGTTVGSLSGAGNVELGAQTLSEGSLNLSDIISGVISGVNGGLAKIGSGTLTLTGDNTYTGSTAVQQGVLLVNGNQQAATGDVTVDALSTLGGAGTSGGKVTVADNAHLAAGADLASVGVLTLGGLTLANNAQVDFQFGQAFTPGGTLNDLININGDLNLDGKLNITQTPGGVFNVGLYRVFNYTGNLINNIMDIGTAPDAADDLYVQTSIAGQVNLVNRTGVVLRFWDGDLMASKNNGGIDGGNGIWQNSRGNDNWSTDATDPDGLFNAPFSDGSFAVFGGEKGTVTVDNSLGEVLISGAQFATDGYVINDGTITTNTADTLIRVGDGTAPSANYTATINSVIAGTGGIDKADVGTLLLNGNNTYSGGTTVSGGTLQVSQDANLGQAGTSITLNGGTFRYGAAFNTDRNLTVAANGGTLDTNGYNVSLLGAASGSGALTKAGAGTLTLTQDSSYTGGTTISEGNLQLGTGGEQGSVIGNIVDNGVLQVNRSNELALTGNISGTGQLWQQGSGTTVLGGTNTYSGITLVERGTLQAQGANRFSAASSHIVSSGATLDTGGENQTVNSLVNQGTVNLRGGDVGSTLTVNGDYVGLNGVLKIAAQQHSPGVADHLVINGGTATGKTLLDIDVSQLGEQTEGDGILVVDAVNGATTTAQTTKDAFTIGADHLEAGAWEYRLFAGNGLGEGEDWFLRTSYRPEVPIFVTIPSTIRQGDLAVLGTLHQRVGDEQPWNTSVSQDNDQRFWARYISQSTHQAFNDATASQTDSNINGMQIGFDLYVDENWRAGMYTAIVDNDTSIQGANSGGYGTAGYNSTLSTYVAGYATYTAQSGFYVDNVLQYGNHSIDLKNAQNRNSYSPDGNSFVASVETGYPIRFGDTNWAFEPQAQLIWQHSDFDSVILQGDAKTRASVDADDAIIGRIGARLTAEYETGVGKVKPYVRVNLWQQLSNGQDTATFENTTNNAGKSVITADQKYSTTEAAVGATWTIYKNAEAYTEVGKMWSNGGSDTSISSDINASVGMKIRF